MLLHLGPQHPSTHGVLRLVLRLAGETVLDCTPVIGYLHRGIEKILENRPMLGGIRYVDNADYLSPVLNELAYAGAVDKLIGHGLLNGTFPYSRHILMVSGRTSFEIIQKALLARIPCIAAISAPSSLAVELADQAGVTLIGFLRDQSMNVYTHPERIV